MTFILPASRLETQRYTLIIRRQRRSGLEPKGCNVNYL